MKCPFRTESHYEYVDLGNGNISLDHQIQEYPECYKEDCPLWRYNYNEGGYHCIRARIIDETDGESDCEGEEY